MENVIENFLRHLCDFLVLISPLVESKKLSKTFCLYHLPCPRLFLFASCTRSLLENQLNSSPAHAQWNLSPITNSRNINQCQMIYYTLVYLFICWWRTWESNANELNVANVFAAISLSFAALRLFRFPLSALRFSRFYFCFSFLLFFAIKFHL